jgi:hypothetical protein
MVNSIGNTNAVAGSPTYSGRMLRQLASPAFAGATAARPLGSLTGVRPGTPANTITATSTVWTAQPFAGNADVESLAIAGGYPFAFDAVQTGAVTPASASYPRADIMYVQIDDPSEDGSATPAATLKYLAATVLVGGVLTAPLPVTRAFIVATINVPISGGGSPSVTWVAPYTVAAGGIQPVPAGVYPASPSLGQYVDDATRGLLRWNGTAWVAVASGLNPIIPTSVSGGTVSPGGTVTYTAVASVTLNGVFTSAFDNYLVIIDNSAKSASANMAFQYAVAGVADAVAANYSAVRGYDTGSARTVGTTAAGTLAAIEVEAGTQGTTHIEVTVFGPAKAASSQLRATSSAFPYQADVTGSHGPASAYDGFRLSPNPSGTITGIVRVYGYNNN